MIFLMITAGRHGLFSWTTQKSSARCASDASQEQRVTYASVETKKWAFL